MIPYSNHTLVIALAAGAVYQHTGCQASLLYKKDVYAYCLAQNPTLTMLHIMKHALVPKIHRPHGQEKLLA